MNTASTTSNFVRDFFEGIEREVRSDIPASTRTALVAYYRPAGLLSAGRRAYFFQHYTEPLARALQFLVLDQAAFHPPVILDLGCGLGSQSIIFAAHGARVIAFDLDAPALEVLAARKMWYEKKLGRSLDITAVYGNALEYDLGSLGPIHGVFSLFAFNMMQPTAKLLDRLAAHTPSEARLAIQDGNRLSVYNWLTGRRRQVLSPPQFRQELELRGFQVVHQEAMACIPPLVCALMPKGCRSWLHEALRGTWKIGVSHQIMAGRT